MLLRRALLALAVLTSAAVAAVLGFAVYLFTAGYSGGSNPQSIAPLAFPLSFLVLLIVGLPAALICAAAWAGTSPRPAGAASLRNDAGGISSRLGRRRIATMITIRAQTSKIAATVKEVAMPWART